jgi:peptidoglycan/xylan/chitin deacetylase (PgdA/CDA1 family)
MSIRKDFIAYTSSVSGFLPLDLLCRMAGQNFIAPFYHIVSDEDCPHVSHLYRYKNVREFERDIDYLARNYTPISSHDLPNMLAGKYAGQKIMLLTFDDGLRQMYEVVAPILLRKGIPAVFFLNTDFIDNKALMFRYKASLAVEKDPDRYFRAMIVSESNKQFIEETKGEMEEGCKDFLKNYKPYMNIEQVRALIGQGFAIGSHSCSHPYYKNISLPQQLDETIVSMNILQKDFDLKERLFAFPFTDHGVSRLFFEKIFTEGRIDFSFGGAGIKADIDARQIQRIPMEGWAASAEQILKSEYLYYLLRMPFFKNKIKRI